MAVLSDASKKAVYDRDVVVFPSVSDLESTFILDMMPVS